jgi:hypothetical protein
LQKTPLEVESRLTWTYLEPSMAFKII